MDSVSVWRGLASHYKLIFQKMNSKEFRRKCPLPNFKYIRVFPEEDFVWTKYVEDFDMQILSSVCSVCIWYYWFYINNPQFAWKYWQVHTPEVLSSEHLGIVSDSNRTLDQYKLEFLTLESQTIMYVCVCMYVCMSVRMYVCTYVCIYVCMYACMYVCRYYICMYIRMYVCRYVCICVCMCVCMSVCMHICVYVYMYACMYVCRYYVCMYVCMYLCVCVCMSVCMCICMYVCMHICM